MKKSILAALALVAFAAQAALSAQPDYTGAPRSAKVWLNADPFGFSQLKYLAGRDAVLSASDATITNNMWILYIAETNRAQVAEGVLTGQVAGKLNTNAVIDAATLSGYTIEEVMAVGATYYFTTNLVNYGVVTGRSASLTPPTEAQSVTYTGTITNGQVFGQYLIPSNQMPAITQRGVYSFNFFGGHGGNKKPTIGGRLIAKHSATGVTAYQYDSSDPVIIPKGSAPFHILVNITNDIAKDALAVYLETYMIDNDSYEGNFTSTFGPPNYAGFTFPKVNGLYVLKSEFDATPIAERFGSCTYSGTNIISSCSTGNVFRLTLTNAVSVLATPTNVVNGTYLKWTFIQGTGTNELLLSSDYVLPLGVTSFSIATNTNYRVKMVGDYEDGKVWVSGLMFWSN